MAIPVTTYYKLIFFIPHDHKERVKEALFVQGAGRYQGYCRCAWETKGMGQFQPERDSQPYIGQADKLTQLEEYRVEVLCQASCLQQVITALLATHPYEVPAYEVYPILTAENIQTIK